VRNASGRPIGVLGWASDGPAPGGGRPAVEQEVPPADDVPPDDA
jgi:hypothetical protein